MLTASILICWQGQAYLDETSIGQDLSNDDRVKIICGRPERDDATIANLTSKQWCLLAVDCGLTLS